MTQNSQHHFKRALVTGATGMVGEALCRRLLAGGGDVVGLARGATAPKPEGSFRFVSGDVRDADVLADAVQGCDIIFHAAALVPGKPVSNDEYFRVNVDGTSTAVEAAVAGGARFVHISSVNAGQAAESLVDPYSRSKAEAEAIVLENRERGLDAIVVRPGPVFGVEPGRTGRIIDSFLAGRMPVLPLADRRMCPVSANDLATALVAAGERGTSGRTYLVGGPCITMKEFIEEVARASGRPAPRLSIPSWVFVPALWMLWKARPITRITPPMTVSAARRGVQFDGTSAAKELGFTYAPLPVALAGLNPKNV